jgi:enamine deaminase RidA (YjgF/YER057c/UK114 family)
MDKNKVKRISTGAKWEDIVGYSRAVKYGSTVEITGTIALDEGGNVVGVGDAGEQTRHIIKIAENVLKELGGGLEDVIRSRIYVTDIDRWEEVAKAHGEYFSSIKPCATMVEISRLIIPEALVEMEFSAIIDE